jgi:hypothetical protein
MPKLVVCRECERLAHQASEVLASHFAASRSDRSSAGKGATDVLKAVEKHKLRTGHNALQAGALHRIPPRRKTDTARKP